MKLIKNYQYHINDINALDLVSVMEIDQDGACAITIENMTFKASKDDLNRDDHFIDFWRLENDLDAFLCVPKSTLDESLNIYYDELYFKD